MPVHRSAPATFGAHPLSFSPLPFPSLPLPCPHLPSVLATLSFPSPLLPSLPVLLASLDSFLLHLHQFTLWRCHVLSSLTSPVTRCLCRGLSSLFPLFPFPFLLQVGSTPKIQEFWLSWSSCAPIDGCPLINILSHLVNLTSSKVICKQVGVWVCEWSH